MWQARIKKKNKRFEEATRPLAEGVRLPEIDETTTLLAVLQECISEKSYYKGSFMKLVQYLKTTDFKKMNLQFLSQDSSFFVLKAINSWIVDIFSDSQHEQMPSHIIVLTEFYRFAIKSIKSRIQSEKMWTAYAYFLNNIALISLRQKQYSRSIQYLEQVHEIYQTQGIEHSIFSIACANLATLYRQLKDYSASQYYIHQAVTITKDLMNQMIMEKATNFEISEVANLLATQYTLMSYILRENHPKHRDSQKLVQELVEKDYVRLNNRLWYVKNLIEQLKKGDRAYLRVFLDVFSINLTEFRFYGQTSDDAPLETKTRLAPLNLPALSSNYANLTPTPKKNHNRAKSRYEQPPQEIVIKDTGVVAFVSQPIVAASHHQPHPVELNKQIKEYYANIQNQNKQLKTVLDELLKKQYDTQKMIGEMILPKIAEMVLNAIPVAPPPQTINTIDSRAEGCLKFKTLRATIEFKPQGVILTSFVDSSEEKLEWSSLKYLLNNLQLTQLFDSQLNMLGSQHQIAKMLFNYIEVDKKIKVWRNPIPCFSMKISPEASMHFFYSHNREFKIAYTVKQTLECIIRCEMCQKSFSKFFTLYKHDEYSEDVRQKMLGVITKKKQFYVAVVKYVEDSRLENDLITTSLNLDKVMTELLKKLKENTNQTQQPFIKLSLQFDEFQNSKIFRSSLYVVTSKDSEQKLKLKIHNLSATSDDPTEAVVLDRQVNYWQILMNYGITYTALQEHYKNFIKYFVCDLFRVKYDTVKCQNKNKVIVHLEAGSIETGYFIQQFVDQKFFRPVRLVVVGANKKIHGIKFSLYNQYRNAQDSFFIICQDEIDRPKHGTTKAETIKQSMLTKLLKKLNLTQIYTRYKKKKVEDRDPLMHLQTFLQLYS